MTMEIPALPGVYPIGEGAGYAGGIVTAAVDGLRGSQNNCQTSLSGCVAEQWKVLTSSP